MPYNSIHTGQVIDQAISKVVGSGKLVNVTAGATVAASHIGKTIVFTSESDANFTIPNDTTLGLAADDNASFEIFQNGNGVPSVIGGAGVTVNTWVGYPTSAQYVTQTIHRVGPNTWAVK